MSFSSRSPRNFGTPPVRAALFRIADSGGIRLNVPVYAELPGQLSRISSSRGARLRLGAGIGDSFLEPSDSGGIRIQIA